MTTTDRSMVRRLRPHLGFGALLLLVLGVVQYWPVFA